jgi:nucleoside-diphosphate-sugar epimerase
VASSEKLRVAVTGPTGEIGRSFIRALERSRSVGEIRGMARRPFDPKELGWRRTEYVQGDILDRAAVEKFVEGADVVVHLAFIIWGGRDEARRINLEGSRNVFEATAASAAKRLVYTSSVAAYGFHPENPQPLTEDVPARGSESLYYSAHKAELEEVLASSLNASGTESYVLRPCIVGGEDAPALVAQLPYVKASAALPEPLRRLARAVPGASPVLPEFGVPVQLVHSDDVATALRAAALGRGEPGIYNLAASGEVSLSDIAGELGWWSVKVPKGAVLAVAEVLDRMPFTPAQVDWVQAVRVPVVMDTSRARKLLRWRPKHDARETLTLTVKGARERGLVGE